MFAGVWADVATTFFCLSRFYPIVLADEGPGVYTNSGKYRLIPWNRPVQVTVSHWLLHKHVWIKPEGENALLYLPGFLHDTESFVAAVKRSGGQYHPILRALAATEE